jgi:hypothetical protein
VGLARDPRRVGLGLVDMGLWPSWHGSFLGLPLVCWVFLILVGCG